MIARYLWLIVVVALLLGTRLHLAGAGRTPSGQPALADVDDLAVLQAEFNRDPAALRVMVLVSPSCPYCLQGASSVQRVLREHAGRPLVVLVVWEPIQPTDWGRPRTGPLHRIADGRARQYWDPDHRVATALRTAFGMREAQPDCCEYRGVWWDMMAVFPAGARWGDTLPEPVLLAGTVQDAVPAFTAIFDR